MKKKLIFAAAAIAMLASCSQNDLEAPVVGQAQQSDAIEFGTYLGKAATSRAGFVGEITDTELKSDAKADGFGVFAYFTGNTNYPNVTADPTPAPGTVDANTNKPNFMYNQQVAWNSTSSLWGYTPLKYWPNDFANTAVDVPGATGSTTYGGKLSFFAYAPYVTKAAADGTGTGIISMSDNNVAGNPTVTYKMASTGKNVDILWGTCPTDATGNYNVAPSGTQTGGYVWGNEGSPATIKNYGKTNVNLTKQKTDDTEADAEKVNFLFKHALAKVGGGSKGTTPSTSGLQIKLDPDFGDSFGAGAETVVTVDHIKISQNNDKTIAPPAYDHNKKNQGILDLATGIWTPSGDQDEFSQTIKAGATNDNEAELNPNIKEIAVNTTIDLVTNTTWVDATGGLVNGDHKGVLKTTQPVYDENQDVKPLLYFPGEIPSLDIEIEYVVRTKDANLENGYSEVTQKITKNVTFGTSVEMNKRYNLLIILGLTSVKFEATVADWTIVTDLDNSGGEDENDHVNLPLNVE